MGGDKWGARTHRLTVPIESHAYAGCIWLIVMTTQTSSVHDTG